jgi:hypothetical protein
MRRLARHFFAFCSIVSLLLCVGVCVLWVRSYRAGEQFWVRNLFDSVLQVDALRGQIRIKHRESVDPDSSIEHPIQYGHDTYPLIWWGVTVGTSVMREYPNQWVWGPLSYGSRPMPANPQAQALLKKSQAIHDRFVLLPRPLLPPNSWEELLRQGELESDAINAFSVLESQAACRELYVSGWFAAAMLLILPGIVGTRFVKQMYVARRLRVRGLCPTCGYDLRASPERCPECGNVPTKGST